jgi:hypothetical protein
MWDGMGALQGAAYLLNLPNRTNFSGPQSDTTWQIEQP